MMYAEIEVKNIISYLTTLMRLAMCTGSGSGLDSAVRSVHALVPVLNDW